MTNFYSIQFLTFLLISLLAYYTVFRKKQWIGLLIISAIFYSCTGIENFVFLLLTAGTTWAGSIYLDKLSVGLKEIKKDKTLDKTIKNLQKAKLTRQRRIIMWCVVLFNFGMLAFLKLDTVLGLVFPLGISFYMFQSIGFFLDIYYEKYEAEKNFAKYITFVSYFPQLIQGPINRFDAMSDQLYTEHKWSGMHAMKAVYRLGYGLFKKYAIANIFAGIIVNIFDNPVKDYSGIIVLCGILLYSAQQYADFSGGIDMVLGVSELFGIRMMENFKQPYFSTSLADFWRRWHISLGKWMRDYVFYPFALTKPMKNMGKWANKRFGKHMGRVLPAALGNLLVFFIVGIWHGVKGHYVIWGLYNGMVIAFSDIMAPVYEKMTSMLHINTKSFGYKVFQIIRTFIVVNIGWYFDRITNVKTALYSMKKTFFDFNIEFFDKEWMIVTDGYVDYAVPLAIVACIIVFCVSVLEERNVDVKTKIYESPLVVRWGIYIFVIGMILISSMCVNGTGGFMYANF